MRTTFSALRTGSVVRRPHQARPPCSGGGVCQRQTGMARQYRREDPPPCSKRCPPGLQDHAHLHPLPGCRPSIGSTPALESAKPRFALRLRMVNSQHPLVPRITPPLITRGRGTGTRQRLKTKVQVLGSLSPEVPRPTLALPHFSPGWLDDPTGGLDKEAAAAAFKAWWNSLPPTDITIFTDGSEQAHAGADALAAQGPCKTPRPQVSKPCPRQAESARSQSPSSRRPNSSGETKPSSSSPPGAGAGRSSGASDTRSSIPGTQPPSPDTSPMASHQIRTRRLRVVSPKVQPRRHQAHLLLRGQQATAAPCPLPDNATPLPALAQAAQLTPSGKSEAVSYLSTLEPGDFQDLLEITEFYSRVCTRWAQQTQSQRSFTYLFCAAPPFPPSFLGHWP